ncbi:hypothetical protein ACL02U_19880 [Streptomyces sp. MS06]|uniref:hypothetical protein n=1 Tax=Streptomyces sp. MS06 TaxID=3385974 RepID=UPI00399FC448
MAHAAPAPVGRGSTPMIGPGRSRGRTLAWAGTAVALGLVYGYWAAANRRYGGEITGWNVLFGFVTAAVFAVLFAGLHALAPRLRREVRAVSWAAFTGCAVGFLFSQSNGSVLRSVGLSLALAAGVFLVLFYRYYTHEDAAGHRLP